MAVVGDDDISGTRLACSRGGCRDLRLSVSRRLKAPTAQEMIRRAAADIGTEPGGMDTPASPDPATGRPWHDRFCPKSITIERTRLMVACYVVIAYPSGMRDCEKRAELHLMHHSADPHKWRFRSSVRY